MLSVHDGGASSPMSMCGRASPESHQCITYAASTSSTDLKCSASVATSASGYGFGFLSRILPSSAVCHPSPAAVYKVGFGGVSPKYSHPAAEYFASRSNATSAFVMNFPYRLPGLTISSGGMSFVYSKKSRGANGMAWTTFPSGAVFANSCRRCREVKNGMRCFPSCIVIDWIDISAWVSSRRPSPCMMKYTHSAFISSW
mmetsp:Transcript_95727/g.273082  ORF Transcript_95727/g.273082 Transcript_95727/m.273082 type:complete len:200 (+) Transcript_95727:203-802(+)